ncbi:unnamed protein product [Prorocentrum cordatum]|uniref:Uncharacterized protein n=1 Tax=Prorocentrum cordatum TaxID=2364126 RepID=A0ABN9RQU3_9DINO|nr:unnamed protein product [Polarella glacialis]
MVAAALAGGSGASSAISRVASLPAISARQQDADDLARASRRSEIRCRLARERRRRLGLRSEADLLREQLECFAEAELPRQRSPGHRRPLAEAPVHGAPRLTPRALERHLAAYGPLQAEESRAALRSCGGASAAAAEVLEWKMRFHSGRDRRKRSAAECQVGPPSVASWGRLVWSSRARRTRSRVALSTWSLATLLNRFAHSAGP